MNAKAFLERRAEQLARSRKSNSLIAALRPLMGDIREGARYDTRWQAVVDAYEAAVARGKKHAA